MYDDAFAQDTAQAKATPTGLPGRASEYGDADAAGGVTLEQTPARLRALLRGVGTSKPVREVLRSIGYTAEEHARGWALLLRCAGSVEGEAADDAVVAETFAAIDAWVEPTFAVVESALRQRHPAQCAFVLGDAKPARGAGAVAGVRAFLSRLDALESAPERASTRAADRAALAALAARGVTAAERRRVAGLVRAAEVLQGCGLPDDRDLTPAARQGRLCEARAFYDEWSTIARTVVSRRDLLVRFGLAPRKAPARKAGKRAAPGCDAPMTA